MQALRRIARWFGWGRFIALLLLIGFVQIRAMDSVFLESLLGRTFDLYQWLSPRDASQRPVIIVDIDEDSIADYGQWPWPRTRIATMIDNVKKNGGVALGFDMVFAEPDRLNPDNLADQLAMLDDSTRQTLRESRSNDQIMADAITNSRVVLGRSGYYLAPKDDSAADLPWTRFATLGGDPRPYLQYFPSALANIPVLEHAAAGRGFFSITPELGGIIRRVPLLQNVEGRISPVLSLELLRVAGNTDTIIVRRGELGIEQVVVGDRAIPTDERARFWVHYAPHDSARFISARDVIENTEAAKELKDKLVLVGTSAVGLFDLKATPVHPAMPGVEIHAQVLENILTGSFLLRPANAVGGEVLLSLLIGLAVIILVPILGAFRVLLLGAAIAVAVGSLAWYAYKEHRILIDVVYPLMSSLVVFFALVFINYMREENERRQIRGAFSQYLAPAMVEQLANDPSKLVLGGETRNLTLLFSDIRGFTSISETYLDNPQGLTALINRMLTPLSAAIIEARGTIDKYIGDAIVAFWNAPLEDPDHPQHACKAALQMMQRLRELNEERQREAAEAGETTVELRIGIGINTGDVVVGNVGSEMRFDYSVLGDSVNLCARLEDQTKTYKLPVILGPSTAELVRDEFAVLEIDRIRVTGKTEPTTVYTLVGDNEIRNSEIFATTQDRITALMTAFQAQHFAVAENALQACRELPDPFKVSPLYDLYAGRLKNFARTPPSPDWDGVMDMAKH